MGTEKRARQKANRQARLAQVEAKEVKESREASTKKFGKIAAVVAAVIALFVLFNVLTGGDEQEVGTFNAEPDATVEAAPTPEIELASSIPDDFEPFSGTGALALVEPSARNDAYDSAPPMAIDQTKNYNAVIDTSVGPIRLKLFANEAPLAVNNFVGLARDGYYDALSFHRVIDGFMAQGGDPLGDGVGGPGYSFADEFDPNLVFDKRGQLAMANSGPATNGSQFFITFEANPSTANLTGKHTIFGEIVDDAVALDAISANGPTVTINTIRIIES